MSYVAWFKDLTKDSIAVAGGKGANLGEMFNLGIPVPGGFAVTAQCYGEYFTKTGLQPNILSLLKSLDPENNDQLQAVSRQIAALFAATPIPADMAEEIMESYELLGASRKNAHDFVSGMEEFVAVRSSATAEDLPTASFAGQQATFLNVKGKKNVLIAVRDCWASLFTARAIYYRTKNEFDHSKVLISAIVQKMVNADKSGIMFTVNPATNQGNEIVIEAIYGLGEFIVGGEVNPDMYIVDKNNRDIKKIEIRKKEKGVFRTALGSNETRIIPREIQERQVLNDKEILELTRLGKKLEEHYGRPQDIEWAVEQGTVYIVQTRAVTTFKAAVQERPAVQEEQGKIILKGETASAGVYCGPVRIVLQASELGKVQKGDILVTPMTTPDMVPAMQKAGAIVTNEGGLTCHAAIVAREMGTPCIVGTEHATEVLKDGEIVTVHASRGIVYEGEIEVAKEEKLVALKE